MGIFYSFILLGLVSSLSTLAFSSGSASNALPLFDYTILATKTHNKKSFTQGWIKDGNTFYESSGHYGRSFIQRYDNKTTTTRHLPSRYFAEGLTLLNNTIYLLTWREETLLVIDKDSLATIQQLPYRGEGWGLTHNNQHLIMSNGTMKLSFHNSLDFSIIKSLNVKHPAIKDNLMLNELEYVDSIIWANSWKSDNVYAINAKNGCILGALDLHALRHDLKPQKGEVLNGIAYDKARNGLWVTGKNWPKKYLITLPSIQHLIKSDC